MQIRIGNFKFLTIAHKMSLPLHTIKTKLEIRYFAYTSIS